MAGVPFAGALADAPSLPDGYWRQPLAAQGRAPHAWPAGERSLKPDDCGECHGDKLADWRASFHARAFSPGLVGQLLTYNAADAASCMECHAPLAEQKAAFEAARNAGKGDVSNAQGLAAAGNSCGGCHVRGNRRYGPPAKEDGAVGWSDPAGPHGGAMRSPDFEKSDFCAACHQFAPDQAINGKPLENTLAEWRASPQAAAGKTCQSCHMPDRRHLWRGIHDPAMVASGLTASTPSCARAAVFQLSNTGIGHAFPTYVTPKVVMHGILLDEAGQPLPGSEASLVIQRRIEAVGSDWTEISDTRLLPGQTARLVIAWGVARRARVWLEVLPDDYYHTATYADLLRTLPDGGAPKRLIEQADRRARQSAYVLFETVVERP